MYYCGLECGGTTFVAALALCDDLENLTERQVFPTTTPAETLPQV